MEQQRERPGDGDCLLEAEYRTTREDVAEGLALLTRAQYPRRWFFPAVLGLFAVCMLWVLPAASAIFLAGALYALYSRWLRPWLRHRGLADEIAAKNAAYRLRVFEKGISVTEGETVHRMFYEDLRFAEGKDVFLLVCRQSTMVVLPKRFLGGGAGELFARKMERL